MEIINCKGVSFTYPTSEYKALDLVDFSVNEGELCLVIGESAAGKSTLLKLLKKEIAPSGKLTGDISIGGSVGYVAQNVDESIVCDKVRAELSFGLTNMGMPGDEIDLLVAETASYFNLEDKLDRDISTLSGGEKQMLNLASVMIMKPSVLVLDEPASQLDPVSAITFIEMVKKLHTDFGLTIIISEHNTDNLYSYADSVFYISNGKSVFKANPIDMVKYLKQNGAGIIGAIPLYMWLFDGAYTVNDCKNALKNKTLSKIEINENKDNISLEARGMTFAYKKNNDTLSDLDFCAYSGKINAIVGPNSSGKTTLLKVLSSVNKPHRGKVKVGGKIAMLCQNPLDLFTFDTCREEVEFGELTSYLKLDGIENRHPYDLSGGQAQRLALAKVLQTGADIILLDEPTKGLDADLKVSLASLLRDLASDGKTIIIVSHDIEFVGQYSDYVSFLSRGKIVTTQRREAFFTSLNFYTTAVSRITNGIAKNIASVDDLRKAGGLE